VEAAEAAAAAQQQRRAAVGVADLPEEHHLLVVGDAGLGPVGEGGELGGGWIFWGGTRVRVWVCGWLILLLLWLLVLLHPAPHPTAQPNQRTCVCTSRVQSLMVGGTV
jgi:hypothetical protein